MTRTATFVDRLRRALPALPVEAFALLACLASVACGSSSDPQPGGDAGPDSGVSAACPRDPAPADRDRFAVVAHPFANGGGQAPVYEVLALSASGELSLTGNTFELGARAASGTIAFTPDGEVGVVALDDGNLGVFTLDGAGAPTVVHASFAGDFYASGVRIAPSGDRVYVLDSQFRENGGGIYSFAIDCDGQLAAEGMLAPAKLAQDLLWIDGGRAVVPADDALDSPADFDLHLVDFSAETPSWIAGAAVFGGTDSIVGSAALTASGTYALIGDTCGFCDDPNRIGIAEVKADALIQRQVIAPFDDPYDLIASPFDDRVLVARGFGDALFELTPTGDPTTPYAQPTELTYAGNAPEIPGNGVMIRRGSLTGLVLLPENLGVRRIQFHDGAAIEDLGRFQVGDDSASISGALGVQP